MKYEILEFSPLNDDNRECNGNAFHFNPLDEKGQPETELLTNGFIPLAVVPAKRNDRTYHILRRMTEIANSNLSETVKLFFLTVLAQAITDDDAEPWDVKEIIADERKKIYTRFGSGEIIS